MAVTGTQIETDARRALNDEDGANQRYSSADILAWINEFCRMIWSKRTDSRYADDGSLNAFAELAAIGNSIPFDHDKWRDAILQGVLTRCLESEGDDTDDLSRAQRHANNFTAATGIPLAVRTR